MQIADKIFALFGTWKAREDTYIDANVRGVFENFNRLLAHDLDSLVANVDGYIDNLLFYRSLQDRYIALYLEAKGCYLDTTLYDNAHLRALIRVLTQLNNIRGTTPSYVVMFRWLGFESVVIEEDFHFYAFDSPLELDSSSRPHLDSRNRCRTCTPYDIHLTGTLDLTPSLYAQIMDVLKYIEPINAQLRTITYNGFDITDGQFLFFEISELGELRFTTLNDNWGGNVQLDDSGTLIVELPSELAPFWTFSFNPFGEVVLNII